MAKRPDYEAEGDRGRIWEATYAAAFVASFGRTLAMLYADGKYRGAFDKALENNAEEACTVADAAVAQLDDWVRNGR